MNIEQFFSSQITDEIRDMVRGRILDGTNLAARGCCRQKAKLALLLVIEINPREVLTRSEAAILYGVTEKTLRDGNTEIKNGVNL
jgi:hypothetical protein